MEEEEAPAETAKTKALHVSEMIIKALSVTRYRVGTSKFIRQALGAGGYDVEKKQNKIYINKCLRSLVEKGIVIRTKGAGASGSFKLSKEFEIEAKKKAVAIAKKQEIAKKKKEANAQRREANAQMREAIAQMRAAKKRNLETSASAGRKSARIQSMIRTSDG